MNLPCANCTVGDWGACHHAEYGECMYIKLKEADMKKIYTKQELRSFNAFALWSLAEQIKVANFEHLPQLDLIEAILEIQEKLITENQEL